LFHRNIGLAALTSLLFLAGAGGAVLADDTAAPSTSAQSLLGQSKIPEANEAIKKGDALDEKGKHKEAVAQYREAIRLDPDCSKAHQRLGGCLAKFFDDYDTAILEEQTAIKLEPKYYLPHVVLGEVYGNQQKNEEAIKEFHLAIALNPTSYNTLKGIGIICEQLSASADNPNEYLDEGIKASQKASEIKPDKADAYINLGVLLGLKGSYQDAIKAENQAIQLSPNDVRCYINLGNIYADSGDLDNSIKSFEDAIRVSKNHPNAHSGLGRMLLKKGNVKDAIAEQRKALKIAPDFFVAHRRLAEALVADGDKAGAAAEFKEAIKLNANDTATRVQYAKLLVAQGDTTEASNQYHKALEINPKAKIAQDGLDELAGKTTTK
jgi:tetratricopeptide (TPR) repeat protein